MAKILYVEDDPSIAITVEEYFSAEGHQVEIASNGEDALQLLNNSSYDIILLDWDLPGIKGIDVCKAYRKIGGTSWIVFLTGRTDLEDVEAGLNIGADDYLKKPFELRELKARISSGLRRGANTFQSDLKVKDVTLSLSKKSLSIIEASILLTAKETALLEFLMRNPDRHFSSKALLASVWPSDAEVSEGTVRSFMRILRQKLETAGRPDFIRTDLGSGYIVDSH